MNASFLDAVNLVRNYPNQFSDYSDGVDLNREEVIELLQDALESLKKNENQDSSYCATGNTMVIIMKLGPDDVGVYDYEFIVCKNYQTANISSLDNMFKTENDAKIFFS